jgi:hypothetical protein
LVCKIRVGSFGAEAQPASNKEKEANAMAGTNKGRIGFILKIKFDGGDFPPITDKEELAFRNGHYYF